MPVLPDVKSKYAMSSAAACLGEKVDTANHVRGADDMVTGKTRAERGHVIEIGDDDQERTGMVTDHLVQLGCGLPIDDHGSAAGSTEHRARALRRETTVQGDVPGAGKQGSKDAGVRGC